MLQLLKQGNMKRLVRDGSNLILLPKKLWCSLERENGETCCEVGWLLDQGHAITSKCIFSDNALLKASIIFAQYILHLLCVKRLCSKHPGFLEVFQLTL